MRSFLALALSAVACVVTFTAYRQEADVTASARQPESLAVDGMIPVTSCRLIDTRVELAGSTRGFSRTVPSKTRAAAVSSPTARPQTSFASADSTGERASDPPFGRAPHSELRTIGVAIHRPGTLIGKALEPLASGTGEILVPLSMQ